MQILSIAGNVGKDAVLRRPANGDPVLNFSLAVDNGKDRDGNARPATWYDCSIWGKRAEALDGHIAKGTKLALSGRPSARAHEGKAYLGITVDQLTFQGSSGQRTEEGSRPAGGKSPSAGSSPDVYASGADDDTIPF